MTSVLLTYLGHAAVKLQYGGSAIVIDPYEDGSVPGLGNIREEAVAVYNSHFHGDHFAPDTVTIVDGDNPFTVTDIPCFHDPEGGKLRGENVARVFEAGGIRIAHLGDLGHLPTPEMAEKLQDLDVLLLPVGGHYTIDAEEAKETVKLLSPKLTVPMHYRTQKSGYDVIAPLSDFADDTALYSDSATAAIDGTARGTLVLQQKTML